jgi:hypothetical protein
MVRSASSRVSNHEARGPSFETQRKGASGARTRYAASDILGKLASADWLRPWALAV